jgi:chemotaxis protein histidine kinase CheA
MATMTPADRAKYKTLYLQTSRQYLEKIEQALSMFLNDQHSDEDLKELFIAAHSLAGQSMVIGYTHIGEYASTLQKVVEEKRTSDKAVLEAIQTGVQKIADSFEEIEKNDKELDLSEEIKELEKKAGITGE